MTNGWSVTTGDPPDLQDYLAVVPLPSWLLPAIGLALAVLYLSGALSLWLRGRRWPIGRTLLFLIGCAAIVLVTGLGVERYGYALLSVFMFQQLTLMMLVPPLLVLGSPGTLLLRAVSHRGLGRLVQRLALAALRSRGVRWLMHPIVTVPLFLFFFYGLYLAGLADPILATPFGHVALEVGFLAAGILFAAPILSSDPLPIRMSHPARVIDVTAEVALHAFFGVFLMVSPTLLIDAFATSSQVLGVDPLVDQGVAGGLAWSYGEGPNALILIYVLHRWFRHDTARARAADRRADLHGDPDLDAYNDHLRRLQGDASGATNGAQRATD